MPPKVSKFKSARFALVRDVILHEQMDRYWSDKDYRKAKNEDNRQRARVIVCCADCKKQMAYSSMFPHKKICKGFKEPTELELLTKRMSELNI